MTQENKELLLRDLSARLPYGVKIRCAIPFLEEEDYPIEELTRISKDILTVNGSTTRIEEVKPYLRPMTSMTDKEKKELIRITCGKSAAKYFQVLPDGSIDNTDSEIQDLDKFEVHWINFNVSSTTAYIDWLNANHFDYRGLIPKGLALKAKDGMYK